VFGIFGHIFSIFFDHFFKHFFELKKKHFEHFFEFFCKTHFEHYHLAPPSQPSRWWRQRTERKKIMKKAILKNLKCLNESFCLQMMYKKSRIINDILGFVSQYNFVACLDRSPALIYLYQRCPTVFFLFATFVANK